MRLLEYVVSLLNSFYDSSLGRTIVQLLMLLAAVLAGLALTLSLLLIMAGKRVFSRFPHHSNLGRTETSEGAEDPYMVLGVRIGASQYEIKAAYRELVKKYHPDRIPFDTSAAERAEMEEMMKKINEAYKVLTVTNTPKLTLQPYMQTLDEVWQYIVETERVLSRPDTGVEALKTLHDAAVKLVKTLQKASLNGFPERHYYDTLSELLMLDVITLDEFELLSGIRRRWNDLKRGVIPGNREIAILVRTFKNAFNNIVARYSAKA
jgi:hypothetical protein